MNKLAAFVGHSFSEFDKVLVDKFLTFLNTIKDMNTGFNWDHAEKAEPKLLSIKVKEKMQNKNCFIGICTAKENIIIADKCKQDDNNNFIKINNNDIERKTSDWIIQEIAFALARDMELIILLEEGVRRPGELQGAIEYISFNRETPEKAYNKILEMISSLIPKISPVQTPGVEKPIEKETMKEEEDIKKENGESEPSDDWEYWDYRWALFGHILEGNKEKEKEIFDKYLETETGKDEYNKIQWEVDRLYLLQNLKKEDNMQEIIRIYKEHPKHAYVNSRLALLYENYNEFEKAANLFGDAAQNSKNERQKFNNLCNAARSWAKASNIGEMISSLNEAKDIKELIDDGESVILKTMSEIYDILNDSQNCVALLEGIIDEKPYDHDTRFSLAYKYSKIDEHDLSLYHYKLLIEQRQDKVDWNNIGWARENLKLPGKAIVSYRESEKLGETLAMSNLAYGFIGSGFFDEAKQLCTKAKEISDYHERIDFALAKIAELKKEEDNEEKDIINNTKNIRSFYIEYAHACSKKPLTEFSGKFKGADCDLDIIIKNNKFEARGSFEKTSFEGGLASMYGYGLGMASALALGTQAPIEKKTTMFVEYNGELIGQGIKYTLRIKEKGSTPTILGGNGESGLMIIIDDLSELKVYQKGTRANEKFYSLLRIE